MPRSSRESADLTLGWSVPDGAPSPSPRSTPTPPPSSPSDGPESRISGTSRFWSKTAPVPHDGWICLVWTGSIATNGYGRYWQNGKLMQAHRVSWEMFNGPVPAGMQLDHLCRTRACVRPDHLEVVTQRENLRRGNGWAGQNARKTTCPKGHPFEPGYRRCRVCRREQNARYWEQRRQRLSGQPGFRARTCRSPASGEG
jgi:hypothetical protein